MNARRAPWGGAVFAIIVGTLFASCNGARPPAFIGTAFAPPRRAQQFTLTDQRADPWSLHAQRGKRIALVFGFTHCTDVCPTTLAELARVVRRLGTSGNDIRIVFITVDPERDTPNVLHAYIRRFPNAPLTALTGTQPAIAAVMHKYYAWAKRIPPARRGTGYDMAHTSDVYLIDARGRLRVLEDSDAPAHTFAHDLALLRD